MLRTMTETKSSETIKLVLTLSCPDRPGIVHAVSGMVAGAGGNIIQSAQFADTDTGLFFMRVEMDVPSVHDIHARVEAPAADFQMAWDLDQTGRALRTVIMVSKEGHCLSDLL